MRAQRQRQRGFIGISFTNSRSVKIASGWKATTTAELKVKITRDVPLTTYLFTDFFQGFEQVAAVQAIFGPATGQVLSTLRVEFSGRRGYMGVNPDDGHLLISATYLRTGNLEEIYLDLIHELVHVKQFMEGRELFDDHFSYVERPTEVEAYRHTVQEARRIGFNDERICEYLKTEWMTDEEFKQLANTLGVQCEQVPKVKKPGRT